MISSHIGYYSLLLGFIISVSLLLYSIFYLKKNSQKINQNIFSLLFLQFFIVVISFISLVHSFIISDFSNETVYNNSHSTKPLFYKITGTWGNHEGSLLLWLLVLTLFIFLFIIFSKKQPVKYRLLSIFFQQIIISGFFLFLLLTSNPFNFLFPIPNEGLGLNPILQDPALAIHPPILYLGYVGSSIIFSASLASLIQNNINKLWATHIKKWIQIAWFFLTIGILLGSIWAYYELGWGGFWFWDPVENVSLMPWLCLTALFHTVIVLEKRNLLKSWTLILSIATFTFSMIGTFLVRSGILNSVHTFANDPERGVFILIFLFSLIFLSIILFFIYQVNESNTEKNFFLISKETSILINNWFMMYFLSVVLIGTTYPIFLEVITNEKISIGPPFFNKLMVPFLIFFLIFMALGSNLKWIKDNYKNIKYSKIVLFFICILISFFIVKKTSSDVLFASVLGGASLYLLFVNIREFLSKNNNISQTISHFGFGLFVLSILLNSLFSDEFSANMKLGQELVHKKEQIKFSKIKSIDKENYKSIIANFEIKDDEKNITSLYPEIRIYNQPNILTSEADIKTTIFLDKFIVINLIKGEEIFNVRYQTKPFMIWIWISVCLISIGGMLGVLKKN